MSIRRLLLTTILVTVSLAAAFAVSSGSRRIPPPEPGTGEAALTAVRITPLNPAMICGNHCSPKTHVLADGSQEQ